ncbi:MAG: hypothetical protein AAF184_16195 [Pseudomonadota bacterium]
MHAQRFTFSSLTALLEGIDPQRVALAAGVLVLLVLVWRKLRDGVLMSIVFGAVFLGALGDEDRPPEAEPTPIAATPTVILA